MRVNEILEACLYVDDLELAERFYCGVLGLELVSRQAGRHIFLRCGNRMLLIFDPRESNQQGGEAPPHGATGAGHLAFAVREKDFHRWKGQITAAGVAIEKEVAWPQGGRSLYFRDPAGNSLEVATPRLWGFRECAVMGEAPIG